MTEIEGLQLHLPGFAGPLSGLLAQIENHDLSAVDVPMACVTQQLMEHLARSSGVDLDTAGDHLRASARILVTKSECLLPQSEPEDVDEGPARPMEAIIDRESLAVATRRLGDRQGFECFCAERRESSVERRFEPRSPRLLQRAWAEIQKGQAAARVRVAAPAFVRLEVALSRLLRGLQARSTVSLGSVLSAASRQDAVVHFLAVLELIRRGKARASQRGLFDDITIECVDGERETVSRAG